MALVTRTAVGTATPCKPHLDALSRTALFISFCPIDLPAVFTPIPATVQLYPKPSMGLALVRAQAPLVVGAGD